MKLFRICRCTKFGIVPRPGWVIVCFTTLCHVQCLCLKLPLCKRAKVASSALCSSPCIEWYAELTWWVISTAPLLVLPLACWFLVARGETHTSAFSPPQRSGKQKANRQASPARRLGISRRSSWPSQRPEAPGNNRSGSLCCAGQAPGLPRDRRQHTPPLS